MGGAPSINAFAVPFFPFFPIIIVVTTTLILIASAEDQDTKENTNIPSLEDHNGTAADMSLQSPLSSADPDQVVTKSVTFRPSAAAIVGVLATTFSLTFLLLLYIKHCNGLASNANLEGDMDLQERKNSGIGRTVVDLLPAFKFGSLRGQKHGLECAVCLTGFEDHEILRLLPKCKHAFHMECVDTWLDEHSTCPLCRYKVNPNDILVSHELLSSDVGSGRVTSNIINNNEWSQRENESIGSRRVSFVTERKSEGSLRHHHSRKVKSESVIGEHRLDHQIVISPTCSYTSDSGVHQRWSNFETDDMLYLTSDRIISCSSSSHEGSRRAVKRNRNRGVVDDEMENGFGGSGVGGRRNERDLRSTVSEMTGMMRVLNRDRRRERERRSGGGGGREEQERQQERVASRWWSWISRSQQSSRSRSSSSSE